MILTIHDETGDWHDPDDPQQLHHLARFGTHCLMNTEGARMVLGLEEGKQGNEEFVNASVGDGLNDCQDTRLMEVRYNGLSCSLVIRAFPQLLEGAKFRLKPGGSLRIGVIGVWTEIKVGFIPM